MPVWRSEFVRFAVQTMNETTYRWPTGSMAILYVVIGVILAFQYHFNYTYEETLLFIELLLLYFWIGLLLFYAKIYYDLYLFEPLTIISALYLGIFVLKPVVDLSNHDMIAHGINVLPGGEKATMLVGLGYTALFVAYYSPKKDLLFRGKMLFNWNDLCNMDLRVIYIAWIVVFVLCIVCMLSQGMSIRYIFSFGWEGERTNDTESTPLLFLSNFGITLISLWMMIQVRSPKRWIRISTTLLCIIYLLMRNARWLMLVFLFAPVVFYFTKQRRSPKMLPSLALSIVALMIFAWMQVNRYTLHSGGAMQGWGERGFGLEILIAPLRTDFSTYKTFYSMVLRFPETYPYMLGSTFLYTFVMLIPRAFWHGKPDNPVREMIFRSLNQQARKSGTAVANVGELYANFGVVGIVCGMYLLGWIAAYVKKSILAPLMESESEANNDELRIMYSLVFPLFFQWVARGNFNGNFYLMLFAYLPFLMNRIVAALRRIRE